MLSERLHTTLHKKKSWATLSYCSFDNITKLKTLSNVAQEDPDNFLLEKILRNVVLILLGQHCTGKNPM